MNLEWMLSVVDDDGNEHERTGVARSIPQATRELVQAITDIGEDIDADSDDDE